MKVGCHRNRVLVARGDTLAGGPTPNTRSVAVVVVAAVVVGLLLTGPCCFRDKLISNSYTHVYTWYQITFPTNHDSYESFEILPRVLEARLPWQDYDNNPTNTRDPGFRPIVAITLTSVGMDRYSCTLDDILYSTKIEDLVHFLYLSMFLRFI